MALAKNVKGRKAPHGQKMIELKIRLWTDDIAPKSADILPKHAWTAGVVGIERNTAHGITPKHPRAFNSLLEVGAAIERVLIDNGIELHLSRKMQKYVPE